jgi:outer membrane protein OmpA-like peptidoglycan-associated protein/predicted  nucleic acid-binding Zn-ribbon protein
MVDRQRARQVSGALPSCALLAASLAGLYGADAFASGWTAPAHHPARNLTLVQAAGSESVPAADKASGSQPDAPFAELNEALAAARARLEELSKAAAAAAGQARQELETIKQENQRLQSELATVHASRDELREASRDNAARVAELTGMVEEAAAEAKRLKDELVKLRWQNAQLDTSQTRARAAQQQTEEEARAAQTALNAEVQTLSAAAERSAAEIASLRHELADSQQRLATAGEAAGQVADLQAKVQSAEARSSGLEKQLASLRGEADAVAEERDRAHQRIAEMQSERERLETELASAKDGLGRAEAGRSELEQEVSMLRAAASSAADTARQNLLAVEARIKELNTALAGIEPAAGQPAATPDAGTALATSEGAEAGRRSSTGPVAVAAKEPPRLADAAPTTHKAAAAAGREITVGDDLALIKSSNVAEEPESEALSRLTPDLPLEVRLQVQGLLADLGAKIESGGLRVMVPGGDLFVTNSETIESTAYDTLAKVAELIDAYDDHEVLIVGHTDSIGDEGYNRDLSRRRAELVKQFFVDNFDIEPSRLSTDGLGEAQPIATNATATGRQANRRVDVVILD